MCKAQHKDYCSKHKIHHHRTHHINQPFHPPRQLYLKVSSLWQQSFLGRGSQSKSLPFTKGTQHFGQVIPPKIPRKRLHGK
ncbi:hypothetical protein CR201_G0044230 [Pongo abelii]|uniref:Uncharacterized protein n=1 Tax=Pongo abelii TaxID=9601 RepID=A0A2J8SD88_PONAB|nr:hypothetical protein CR201_G0044230 [Pongo abelii]